MVLPRALFCRVAPTTVSRQQLTHPIQPAHLQSRSYKQVLIKNYSHTVQIRELSQIANSLLPNAALTCTLREHQCEFGHLKGSMSPIPVIVPMYLHCKHKYQTVDESASITDSSLQSHRTSTTFLKSWIFSTVNSMAGSQQKTTEICSVYVKI